MLRSYQGRAMAIPSLLARGRIIKDGLAEVVVQVAQVLIVLLANVFLQFLAGSPGNVPAEGPWFRVCARIIDGGFKVKGVLVGACNPFDHVHLIRMRMACPVDPSAFIEADRVDHECVAFPMSNRMSQPR